MTKEMRELVAAAEMVSECASERNGTATVDARDLARLDAALAAVRQSVGGVRFDRSMIQTWSDVGAGSRR